MIQYVFDKNNVLIGSKEPNLNIKYNPDNPASLQYSYDPRDSILCEKKIEYSQEQTLQRKAGTDEIEIIPDLRGQTAYSKSSGEKFEIDYPGELKAEHTKIEWPGVFYIWDYEQDNWVFDINAAKEAKTGEVKAAFQNQFINGKIYSNTINAEIDANRDSLHNINELLKVMQDADIIQYRLFDNSFKEVSKPDLEGMSLELILEGQAMYSKKWTLEKEIEHAQTSDDLDGINW